MRLKLSVWALIVGLAGLASAVNIDVGRQLFVDDHLVATTTLRRVWHYPVKFKGNPVLRPETADEIHAPFNSTARPNGGGLWWDAKKGVFRLWYEAGWLWSVAYAESKDGIRWERPALDVVPGTNLVFPREWNLHPDSWSVVPDPKGDCWWMFLREPGGTGPGWLLKSADGIHWTKVKRTGLCGDRSTLFYDPFRGEWVYSLRSFFGKWAQPGGTRARCYRSAIDIVAGADWEWKEHADSTDVRAWLKPDALDPKDPLIRRDPQLYNFDAVAYESIMVGMWETHHGPENYDCEKAGLPKITDLMFAYSRDGFSFSRPDRTPAIASERWASDKWDRGYVQSLSNLMVVQGDELWFYYGAFKGDPTRLSRSDETDVPGWNPRNTPRNGLYHNAAMGLAKLRRDGFASMNGSGELVTPPLFFSGDCLFVNADAGNGALGVELQDDQGRPVPGFSAADSRVESFDSTKKRIVWKEHDRLDVPRSKGFVAYRYRLRFVLENAALYSFWISRAPTGESNGYLAGGGPGYAGLRDVPSDESFEPPHVICPDAAHALSTRRHEGIPSIAVSPKGRMWTTWYAGPTAGEDSNNYLVLSTSGDGGVMWNEKWIVDPDFAGPRRVFDPELWLAPDGKIRWIWTDRRGSVHADPAFDQLWMATLDPESGDVIEAPRRIATGVMMNKPTVLEDGTWILPVAGWRERESARCWASTDGGRTFVRRGGVTLPLANRLYDEHTILQRKDGALVSYIRGMNGGRNALWQAESTDGGNTWSAPHLAEVGNLSSRTFVTKLRDGRWLMVKHGKVGEICASRKDLTAVISEDEGRTWKDGLLLDGREGCSYPDGQQLADGTVAIVSDFDRLGAREISFVRFSPDDVIAGSKKPERRIISMGKKK